MMADELAELMQRMEQEHRDLLDRLRDRIAAETLAEFLYWMWSERVEIGIPNYSSYPESVMRYDVLRLADRYALEIETLWRRKQSRSSDASPPPRLEELKSFIRDRYLRAFAARREQLEQFNTIQ